MKKPAIWCAVIFAAAGLSTLLVIRVTNVRANAVRPADARADYNSQCASCHGRDGRGKTMKGKLSHARNLTDASWQNDVSDERLFNSISNGKGKMPAFKKKLSESQIDALVSYVRQLKR